VICMPFLYLPFPIVLSRGEVLVRDGKHGTAPRLLPTLTLCLFMKTNGERE